MLALRIIACYCFRILAGQTLNFDHQYGSNYKIDANFTQEKLLSKWGNIFFLNIIVSWELFVKIASCRPWWYHKQHIFWIRGSNVNSWKRLISSYIYNYKCTNSPTLCYSTSSKPCTISSDPSIRLLFFQLIVQQQFCSNF